MPLSFFHLIVMASREQNPLSHMPQHQVIHRDQSNFFASSYGPQPPTTWQLWKGQSCWLKSSPNSGTIMTQFSSHYKGF